MACLMGNPGRECTGDRCAAAHLASLTSVLALVYRLEDNATAAAPPASRWGRYEIAQNRFCEVGEKHARRSWAWGLRAVHFLLLCI